jgi:hypothetical protein
LLFHSSETITSYAYKPLRTYKVSVPQHAKPLIILDAGMEGQMKELRIHYFMEKKLTLMTNASFAQIPQ